MPAPIRLHLPSGRVVVLEPRAGSEPQARARARERRPGAPLFSEVLDLFAAGDVALRDGSGSPVDPGSLALADFHALRAIATRLGWLAEDAVAFPCRNCGRPITHAPCSTFELGPFRDGELRDPELDRTLDLTVAHPIPPIARGEGGEGSAAVEVRLQPRTVAEAAPLHAALRRMRVKPTAALVTAMGIASLGPERDAERIAATLLRARRGARPSAWTAIGDLFLAAHYPARLFSVVVCAACGARNDVDAPYEREFEPGLEAAAEGGAATSNAELFPAFDAFDAEARALFDRALAGDPRKDRLVLIVDGEVPACDDGGEPLLGSYVPPGGDPSAPVGLGEITLYYRSFRATWEEQGGYDWRADLETTIGHELEHDVGWLTGHDPTDDEERAEIVEERALRVGVRATARSSVVALAYDVRDFIAHTWPLWVIVTAFVVAINECTARGGN